MTPLGQTRDLTITVDNVGTGDLTLSNPQITGGDAADFAILSPTFPAVIGAGGSQVFTVRATANTAGAQYAALSIDADDPDEPVITYDLTYSGAVTPGATSDPAPGSTIEFGKLEIGQLAQALITVSEVGGDGLVLSVATITSGHVEDFEVLTSFPVTILNGAGPEQVAILFSPTAAGIRSAVLEITTNDPDNSILSYTLLGVGQATVDVEPPKGLPRQAAYLVTVHSSVTGEVLALLDSAACQTLRYERKLNDVGAFQLTLPLEEEAGEQLAQKDTLVSIERFVNDGDDWTGYEEGTYIVRFVRRFKDEAGDNWLIVSGYSLEYLLLQRVVIPTNDPLTAGGFSTKQGPADLVMAELVEQQAGAGAGLAEKVPGLSVLASGGIGETVGVRWAWDSLLDALQSLRSRGQMDFEIVRSTGVSLQFNARKIGTDRTKTANYPSQPFVLFSPEFGNMTEPDLSIDWKEERTKVFLKGQGAGHTRTSTRVSHCI